MDASVSRIKAALDSGYTREIGTSLIVELASYYGAVLIASCMRGRTVTTRLAEYEAREMARTLRNETDDIKAQIYSACGVVFDGCRLNMIKYIEIAPKSDAYRLVNRDVSGGYVTVTDDEKCELLQGCIRELILSQYPKSVPKVIKEIFKPQTASLAEYDKDVRDASYGDVDICQFPPCILALYGAVVGGDNIPHIGRFALATFLYTIGVQIDAIIAVFGDSGNTARYQVEHITNLEYTPPSCDAMKSGGVCVAKCGCKNPLNFYKKFGE